MESHPIVVEQVLVVVELNFGLVSIPEWHARVKTLVLDL